MVDRTIVCSKVEILCGNSNCRTPGSLLFIMHDNPDVAILVAALTLEGASGGNTLKSEDVAPCGAYQ